MLIPTNKIFMVQNCPSVFLGMARFELRIQVDPAIVKFLFYHLAKENKKDGTPQLVLTRKNYFGALILSKLSVATYEDVKDNMTGNLHITVPTRYIPELSVSLHNGGAVAIKKQQQKEINNFFKRFMIHHISLELDALDGPIKQRISSIRAKYEITDEEISFNAFEKGYYRYKAQYNKKFSDRYN